MTVCEEDTDCVIKWRNSDSARESFFIKSVVTPDIHRNFILNKKQNDIVFMAYNGNHDRVGMTGLLVDVKNYIGEYGRTFVDENFRGKGYAYEIEKLLLSYGFDALNLNLLWLEAYVSNKAIISLHNKIGWENVKTENEILTMKYSKSMWEEFKVKLNG